LLRKPNTHNTKGGAWIECTRTIVNNARYDPSDVADFLDDVADLRPVHAQDHERQRQVGGALRPE
jgi:cell division septum initiation protein DivIVA